MATRSLVILTLLVLSTAAAAVSSRGTCIREANELKESFLSHKSNNDSIQRALLPANLPSNVQIDVYYHYTTSVTQICNGSNSSQYLKACASDPIDLMELPCDFKFRWSSSCILGFIRPKLLESLSFYTFLAQTADAHVLIDPICNKDSEIETWQGPRDRRAEVSSPGPQAQLLNELTTHLKSYSLEGQFQPNLETSRGYSALYYTCDAEDYEVVDSQTFYKENRTMLTFFFVCLTIFISFSTPHIVMFLYKPTLSPVKRHKRTDAKLHKATDAKLHKATDAKDDKATDVKLLKVTEYFIWGVVVVSFFMYISLLVHGYYILYARWFKEHTEVTDVHINFIIGSICLTSFSFISLFSVIIVGWTSGEVVSEDVSVPLLITVIAKLCIKCCCCVKSPKKFAQLAGLYFFTVNLALVAVHFVYFLLAVMASPIPALATAALYAFGIYFMVCFVAFFLQLIDSRQWIVLCVSLFLGGVLLGVVYCFIAFVIRFAIQVEQYQNNSFVATVFTTVISAFVIWILTRMLERILEAQGPSKTAKDESNSPEPERGIQPTIQEQSDSDAELPEVVVQPADRGPVRRIRGGSERETHTATNTQSSTD